MDVEGLAHIKWNCNYHTVFAPEYRRQTMYGKLKKDVGKMLRDLCTREGVEIVKVELCNDHVHMLVKIPPKISISSFMGYLKGKSTLIVFERYTNLKYKYGQHKFWCRGYYVDTMGRNKRIIEECIKSQIYEDKIYDQMSMKEFIDPFTGEKIKQRIPLRGISSRVQPSSLSHRIFKYSRGRSLIDSEKTTSYIGSFIILRQFDVSEQSTGGSLYVCNPCQLTDLQSDGCLIEIKGISMRKDSLQSNSFFHKRKK